MKKKLQFLGASFILGSFSLTAQTTHNIDWNMSTGGAATITIQVGDEIVWTNTDATSHNVVSTHQDAPAGFGSGTMGNNDTYSFTFNDPVEFSYVCSFHSGAMGGLITVLENIDCAPPSSVSLDNVSSTTADFSWTASPDETSGYSWVVMSLGDDPETGTPVDNGTEASGATSASATGLAGDSQYDFYVETQCGNDGNSGFAGPVNFTTETASLSQNELGGFKFYPNPASETINLSAQENIESVIVYNMMSQKVLSHFPTGNNNSMELNISNLESGSYFLEVKSGSRAGIYKLIKK